MHIYQENKDRAESLTQNRSNCWFATKDTTKAVLRTKQKPKEATHLWLLFVGRQRIMIIANITEKSRCQKASSTQISFQSWKANCAMIKKAPNSLLKRLSITDQRRLLCENFDMNIPLNMLWICVVWLTKSCTPQKLKESQQELTNWLILWFFTRRFLVSTLSASLTENSKDEGVSEMSVQWKLHQVPSQSQRSCRLHKARENWSG